MRLFEHLYCLNIYIGTLPTALMSYRMKRDTRVLSRCCNFNSFLHFSIRILNSLKRKTSLRLHNTKAAKSAT